MPGHTRMARHNVGSCLKRLVSPCACCSSGSNRGWNESFRDYANKPAAGSKLFEGALWPVVSQSQLVTRRQLGGLLIMKRRPQCCPTGWNNAQEVLVYTVVHRCSGEVGPSCAVEPVLLFPVPPPGLVWVGYQLLLLVC